jgi:hypothetical protein
MTSFLSSLSTQFAKNILIGTLFPVMLFVIALTAVVLPLANATPRVIFGIILPWEQASSAPAVIVFILVVTVVLFALNVPLIRLYEGYPWKDSWLGRACTRHHRRQAALLRQVREHARLLIRQAREANVSDALPAEVETLLNLAGPAIGSFPVRQKSILPTRLGNVVRAFEGYPKLKYGIDAIMLWPRLAPILPKEVTESLDSAKASFDFMLNASVLSAVSAVAVVAAGLVGRQSASWSEAITWLPWTALFAALEYLFYLGAINRAASWGTEVKVAFDLKRLDLLSSLGYNVKVSGPAEERALWEEISYQFLFPDAPNLTLIPYKTGQTSLRVTPPSVVVRAERSVTWTSPHVFDIQIIVRNYDQYRHEAQSVEVTEKIAKGLNVVANSVKVEGKPATVRSLDPLVIVAGPLDSTAEKKITYQLQKTD